MKRTILSILCVIAIIALMIPAVYADESFVSIINYDTFDGSDVNDWDAKRMNGGSIENGMLVMRSTSDETQKHGVLWNEIGGITWANHNYVIKSRMTLNKTGAENSYMGLDLATSATGTCTMLVKLVHQDNESFNVMLNAPDTAKKDGKAEPAYAALENVPVGEWIDVLLYISGNTVVYYINGENITSCTFTANRPQVSAGVRYSAQYASEEDPLEGFIDDAEMYAVSTDYSSRLEVKDVQLDGGNIRIDFSEEIIFNGLTLLVDGTDITDDAVETEDQCGIIAPCEACAEFEIHGVSGIFGSNEACGVYEYDSSTGKFGRKRPVVTKYNIVKYDDFTDGMSTNNWSATGGRFENDMLVLTTNGDMIRQTIMYNDKIQGEWKDNVFVLKAEVTLTAVGSPSNSRFEIGLCDDAGATKVRFIQLAKSSDTEFNVLVNKDSNGASFTGSKVISDVALGTKIKTMTFISNDTVKYFINGVLVAQNTFADTPLSEADGVRFSVQFGTSEAPLTAEVDNVQMYGVIGGAPALTVNAEETGTIGTNDSIEVEFSNEVDVGSLSGNVLINSEEVPAARLKTGEKQNSVVILPPDGGYLPQDTLEIVMKNGISDIFTEHLENDCFIQRTTGGWTLSARKTAYSEGANSAEISFSVRNMTNEERKVVFVYGEYEGDVSDPIVRSNASIGIRTIGSFSEKQENITVNRTGTDKFVKVCAVEESGAPVAVFNSRNAEQPIPVGETSLVRENGYIQMIIAGEAEQNEIVSLVLSVDGVIVYADSTIADSSGAYRFALKLAPEMENGIYEYKTSSKEKLLALGSFAVNSENALNGLLKAVQSADSADDVKVGFEQYKYTSLLESYSKINKGELYSYLYSEKNNIINVDEFSAMIEKMAVTAALNQGITVALNEIEVLAGDEDYALYRSMLTGSGASNVNNNILGKSFKTPESACERFRQLLYTNLITNSNTTGIGKATEMFEKYGESLGLNMSRYTGASSKTSVVRAVAASGAATPEALVKAYNAYFTNNTSSGGGGGGGSSVRSSGGTAATPPTSTGNGYQSSALYETNIQNEQKSQKADFSDMAGYDWAIPAVEKLYDVKVISGISETQFAPSREVTREEFVSMLIRVLGIQRQDIETPEFDDVNKGDWFYDAVQIARQTGIVNGYNENSFGSGRAITREEMAATAFRAIRYYSNNLSVEKATYNFADEKDIADFASTAVAVMSGYEIINGYTDGTFRPKETAKRAEAAQMIYNIYELKGSL